MGGFVYLLYRCHNQCLPGKWEHSLIPGEVVQLQNILQAGFTKILFEMPSSPALVFFLHFLMTICSD